MKENQAVETAWDATETVKENAKDWTEKAKGTARDAGAAADLYLHEYAWMSMLGVAISAGLLGYALGARRRH